jgi:hypothetical protein
MLPACYHRFMGRAGLVVCFFLMTSPAASAADRLDPLSEARQLYNQRRFDAALTAAERARLIPAVADRADLIAARAYLERFRESAASDDLTNARDRLRRIDPRRFDLLERTEFIVGLGEALYFEESYGAAADVFETVLDNGNGLPADSRDRVLDWWAIAVDRDAWLRLETARQSAYQRIRARMRDELTTRPGSSTAAYWLAAAARSQGDLQAAWDAVEAGWVRASLAADRGAALRGDLDRLMLVAIVPERARLLGQPADTLKLEWEKFKERWGN